MKIFWRSKEGQAPPPDAKFFLQPFKGELESFSPEVITQLPEPSKPIAVLSRQDLPTRKDWMARVERALEQIESGALQKVVLARQTVFTLAQAPDPFQIAASLAKKAKNASLFCVQFNYKTAFLGASPERLFQRKQQEIRCDAIAGTRKVSADQEADLTNELLSSEKDQREFQFVVDYLQQTLSPHCEYPLTFSPRNVHQASNVQHLFSQGTGKLIPFTTDQTLLQQLHPTPAVCGTPKGKAAMWIEAEEPFDRNLYGGVIGWSTPEESDWTVAIRSCFISGATVCLYTGTGIVAGSDPAEEWDELEAKLNLYAEIFQCGH